MIRSLALVLLAPAVASATIEDDLAGATVTGIYQEPAQFVDGRYEGEPFVEGGAARPTLTLVPWVHHRLDIDADARNETVAYVEESSGGTGHFLYLVVFEPTSDGLVSRAVHRIGDRVQIRRSRVEARSVVLDLLGHGPRDAACCPNQLRRHRFDLNDDGTIRETREILGEAGASTLDGTRWILRSYDYGGDPVPDEIEITLRFQGMRVFGTSGCNRFEGGFTSPRRRELEFGALIGTRMMCETEKMDAEARFLEALGATTQWNFIAGRLALLSIDEEGRPRNLVFERI